MALGPCPRHIAEHRLDGVRKGATILPPGADLIHYLRTGETTPPPPKPNRQTPATPTKPLTVRDILTWALQRNKLVEKSARAEADQDADHTKNLRRAMEWLGRVIDLDRPPPLTAADLQRYIDARRHDPAMQPAGRPGQKTLRSEVGCILALYNHWAGVHQRERLFRLFLEYPEREELAKFRSVTATIKMIEAGGLEGVERREAWHSCYPTVDECRQILVRVREAATVPWLYPLVAWVAYTGCRASEARRTRLTDWVSGMWEVRERKRTRDTETRRKAPIPDKLAAIITDWRSVRPDSEYLFCRTEDADGFSIGDKLGADQVRNALNRTLEGTSWEEFPGLHRFRHAFRSNALAAKVPERVVDSIVGHSTEECRRRYTHAEEETQRQAVDTVYGDL